MTTATDIITLTGMAVEIFGVVIFTRDVIAANNANIERVNAFRDIEMKMESIVVWEETPEERKQHPPTENTSGMDFNDVRIREKDGARLQQIEIAKRGWLVCGALCVFVGFALQAFPTAASLYQSLTR